MGLSLTTPESCLQLGTASWRPLQQHILSVSGKKYEICWLPWLIGKTLNVCQWLHTNSEYFYFCVVLLMLHDLNVSFSIRTHGNLHKPIRHQEMGETNSFSRTHGNQETTTILFYCSVGYDRSGVISAMGPTASVPRHMAPPRWPCCASKALNSRLVGWDADPDVPIWGFLKTIGGPQQSWMVYYYTNGGWLGGSPILRNLHLDLIKCRKSPSWTVYLYNIGIGKFERQCLAGLIFRELFQRFENREHVHALSLVVRVCRVCCSATVIIPHCMQEKCLQKDFAKAEVWVVE